VEWAAIFCPGDLLGFVVLDTDAVSAANENKEETRKSCAVNGLNKTEEGEKWKGKF
jgi:hypothetical protein